MSDLSYIGLYKEHQLINYMEIIWNITSICNYDCTYCTSVPCDKKLSDVYSTLEFIISKFKDKTLGSLVIHGGEPTIHPDLVYVISKFNSIYPNISIELYTNLTASLDFYQSIENMVTLKISWHGEANELDFVSKIEKLNPSNIKVTLMDEPRKEKEIRYIENSLSDKYVVEHCPLLKSFYKNFSGLSESGDFSGVDTQKYYSLGNNGYEQKTMKEVKQACNNFNFKHWKCFSGTNHYCILTNGDVYSCFKSAYLKNRGNYLFNIKEKHKWSRASTIFCPYDYCDDVYIAKKKVF